MRGSRRIGVISLYLFILLFGAAIGFAGTEETPLRILHVNDFHGFALGYRLSESQGKRGGIAGIAALVDKLREGQPTLVLSAGDMIQGDGWANLFQGRPVIEVMNAMGFDAMVLGNHEFDFGQERLRERIWETSFPVLGGNIEGLPGIGPYVIREVGGLRVGIIGVITEDTGIYTHPGNVRGLKFFSPVVALRRYVGELKGRVDLIVVLSHVGYHGDMELAKEVDGIDIIVGGHSHTKLSRPVFVGKTVIVQAWAYGMVLGVLDLTVKDRKVERLEGCLMDIVPGVAPEHPLVARLVKKYAEEVDGLLGRVVGETMVDLDARNARRGETNLGNLAADVIRELAGADCAIMNGGGIRMDIPRGEIRLGDIYSAFPFDNYVVAIEVTGKVIWGILEHGVSAVERKEGRFPQVSGLTFAYDGKAKPGSRVKAVFVKGKPLREEVRYLLATNDFMASGGDGYMILPEAAGLAANTLDSGGIIKGSAVRFSDPGLWVRDAIGDYINRRGKIAPLVEGRIVDVSKEKETERRKRDRERWATKSELPETSSYQSSAKPGNELVTGN
jgi:5'-nucleotidase/UDP-sugar diphosphatase